MSLSFLATRWVALESERLTLRMFRDSDVDAYAEMMGDAEIMRFIGDGKPLTRDLAWRSLAAMIGHWHLRGYGYWAAEERASGQVVGRVGFWNPEGWPGFELGWMLRRGFWGHGLATEAASAALRFAFTRLEQPEVISLIRAENAASIRVAERIGEREDGSVDLFGQPALVYRITRSAWSLLPR